MTELADKQYVQRAFDAAIAKARAEFEATRADAVHPGEVVGGVTGEFEEHADVIVQRAGKWHVYSETAPRKHLGGPYDTKAEAVERLRQVEGHKRDERGPASMAALLVVDPVRAFKLQIGHLPRIDAKIARRRLPRQVPPIRIEEAYATALVKLIGRAEAGYVALIRQLPAIMASAHASARTDAGEGAKVRRLVAAAAEHARKAIATTDIEDLAKKFAAQTSTYQRVQLSRQVHAALGADPVFKDRGLAAATEQFTHENVALIKRIPDRLHGDVESMVQRAVSSARPHPALADEIRARFGVAERHARLIARDQVSKFHGSLNHTRQRELGINKFIWRTVGDERVRDEHDELDGEEFDYDDPPEEGLPSEPVLCRCSAEPVFE